MGLMQLNSIDRVIQMITMQRVSNHVTKEELLQFKEERYEVDLHDMYVDEALTFLRFLLQHTAKHVKQIYVVHGYRSGTALQQAITFKNLKSKRVDRIHPAMNPGVSVIELKVEE